VTNWDRIKCQVGWHKWDVESTREYIGDGEDIVRDHMRCERLGCPRYSMWFVVNAEKHPTTGAFIKQLRVR